MLVFQNKSRKFQISIFLLIQFDNQSTEFQRELQLSAIKFGYTKKLCTLPYSILYTSSSYIQKQYLSP